MLLKYRGLVKCVCAIVIVLCVNVRSQNIPDIPCPNYFQYLSYGDRYVGKLTLPILAGVTKLIVKFSQRQPIQNNYYGQVSLFQDETTTLNNVKNGIPISYRVDFPMPFVLPQLTLISVNDMVICQGNEIPPPSTRISLQHELRSSFQTVPFSANTVNNNNPFGNNQRNQFEGNQNSNTFGGGSAQTNPLFITQNSVNSPFDYRAQNPTTIRNQAPQSTQIAPVQNSQFNTCGQQGSRVTPLVYGGTVISKGQFPWLTALYKKRNAGSDFVCGGSLISAQTVLTAAHCLTYSELNAQNMVVYLGRYNLQDYTEPGSQAFNVQRAIMHPEFNPDTFPDADLALLILQRPASFSDLIQPICLWNESDNPSLIVGNKGYVAGWGKTENGNPISAYPKVVDSIIVSEIDCVRSLSHLLSVTSERTLCAGNRDGTGPCMGDSGGSLMMNRGNRWYVRGVVSAGQSIQSSCDLTQYVVYCDVAKHMTWLRGNMV